MNTWSLATFFAQAAPLASLVANASVSEVAVWPSPRPRLSELPQIEPPLIWIGSATLNVPELVTVPSWVNVADWPDGLLSERILVAATAIVPSVPVVPFDQLWPVASEA